MAWEQYEDSFNGALRTFSVQTGKNEQRQYHTYFKTENFKALFHNILYLILNRQDASLKIN